MAHFFLPTLEKIKNLKIAEILNHKGEDTQLDLPQTTILLIINYWHTFPPHA